MFPGLNFHDTICIMKCAIIAGGDLHYSDDILDLITGCSLVICADGGARHLRQMDMVPHVLMGDFDSIDPQDRQFFEEKGVTIFSFSPQKDKTDSELCLDHALEKNATDITFLGFTGSRMDHTIANIFLLKKLSQQQIPARIINATNEIHIITQSICLEGDPGDTLSLIAVSQKVEGVTLKGLVYPLNNAVLTMGSSLGISNCFKEKTATVTIKSGVLMVTKSKDGPG